MIEPTGSHKYRFACTPKQPGNYTLNLFYGELLLPQCPLVASTGQEQQQQQMQQNAQQLSQQHAQQQQSESRVTLRGQGLAGAYVGQTAQFIVDGSLAGAGEPVCFLTPLDLADASGLDPQAPPSNCSLDRLDDRVYRASYTARVAGVYSLNVLWAGRQVCGCPLKLQIAARADAGRVRLQPPRDLSVGRRSQVEVNLVQAGPGQLTAQLLGPAGPVAVQLSPTPGANGMQLLSFQPTAQGKHVLSVKFAGQHVPGSPFSLVAASAPDASKVKVHGPGVEHGVLPLYQSRFVCDTRGAGAGQLTVRIRGPKGERHFRFHLELCWLYLG